MHHPGHTQERLRERGNDWPHARALRDPVSGRCVRLTVTRGGACRINKTGNDVELAAVELDLDPPEQRDVAFLVAVADLLHTRAPEYPGLPRTVSDPANATAPVADQTVANVEKTAVARAKSLCRPGSNPNNERSWLGLYSYPGQAA